MTGFILEKKKKCDKSTTCEPNGILHPSNKSIPLPPHFVEVNLLLLYWTVVYRCAPRYFARETLLFVASQFRRKKQNEPCLLYCCTHNLANGRILLITQNTRRNRAKDTTNKQTDRQQQAVTQTMRKDLTCVYIYIRIAERTSVHIQHTFRSSYQV